MSGIRVVLFLLAAHCECITIVSVCVYVCMCVCMSELDYCWVWKVTMCITVVHQLEASVLHCVRYHRDTVAITVTTIHHEWKTQIVSPCPCLNSALGRILIPYSHSLVHIHLG